MFVETRRTTAGDITTRQRWSHYFVIGLGILTVFILFNLRQNALDAVSLYQNNEEGIVAYYPLNWMLDEAGGDDYVFRVRNMQEIGYKTTFQLSVQTVGGDIDQRTVFDTLAIRRAQTLTAYRTLSITPFPSLNDREAAAANYQYVATDPNPFQESVPIVVRGIDILTINRDQAIIITMIASSDRFEENWQLFERFLRRLEF
jgi:hypothetical protein